MIKVSDLVTSLRYALGDMQGVNLSDFQLVEALNNAAELLFSRMGQRFIYAALKKTVLIVDDGEKSTALPSDFNGVYRVGLGEQGIAEPVTYRTDCEGMYRIAGTEFYAPSGAYGFEYYYIPAKVHNLTDYIDVPENVRAYLVSIAAAVAKADLALAAQGVELCCDALAGSELSHYPEIGPVQILGGRL